MIILHVVEVESLNLLLGKIESDPPPWDYSGVSLPYH
jgi:hypothetical protein